VYHSDVVNDTWTLDFLYSCVANTEKNFTDYCCQQLCGLELT